MRKQTTGPAASLAETRLLALFASLFLARVLGQLLVSRRPVRLLPPMEQWQSGLLPYPVLLLAQGVILAAQASTVVQSRRGRGALVKPRPRAGLALRRASFAYFSAMIARYCVSMKRFPERRWLGKTIPICAHCVLASYLMVYSRLLSRAPVDDPDRSS